MIIRREALPLMSYWNSIIWQIPNTGRYIIYKTSPDMTIQFFWPASIGLMSMHGGNKMCNIFILSFIVSYGG